MRITVVVPIYQEEKNIAPLYERLEKVTNAIKGTQWEYIFVNDGSTDGSLLVLKHLAEQDKKVKVIDLSRNFGKEIAMTAGIESVDNGTIILMDSDLQHPPELIPKLIKEWEQGAEIVATIRNSVKGQPLIKRLGSWLFYALINRVADTEMMSKTTDFRLLDHRVVMVLKSFTEKTRMVRGLIDWMGFKKVFVQFDAPARTEGNAGYSYRKLFELAIGSLTSFSLFPLRLTGYLGLFIVGLSGLLLGFMLLNQLVLHWTVFSPIAIIMIGNTFLIGIVLCGMGMLAMYIGNIHTEVINRPLYIVRSRINFDDSDRSC